MTPAERERLQLFIARVEELLERRLVTSGNLSANLNIKWAVDQPLSFRSSEPDDEDLRSFLTVFRQFVMKSEPVFVNYIVNVLMRELAGGIWRQHLDEARNHWTRSFKDGSRKLIINERHLSPETVLDWWINGQYFHSDERKRKELASLDPMSRVFARSNFLGALVDTTRYVAYVAHLAKLASS
jgi:hypothetical protein